MAQIPYPYEATKKVQLINGKTRPARKVIFANVFSAYFYHGNKKYTVFPDPSDSETVIVTSVDDVPGHDLPEEEPEA